jgi:hypothetical protein
MDEAELATWRAFLNAHNVVIERIEQDLKAHRLPPLGWYDVLWPDYERFKPSSSSSHTMPPLREVALRLRARERTLIWGGTDLSVWRMQKSAVPKDALHRPRGRVQQECRSPIKGGVARRRRRRSLRTRRRCTGRDGSSWTKPGSPRAVRWPEAAAGQVGGSPSRCAAIRQPGLTSAGPEPGVPDQNPCTRSTRSSVASEEGPPIGRWCQSCSTTRSTGRRRSERAGGDGAREPTVKRLCPRRTGGRSLLRPGRGRRPGSLRCVRPAPARAARAAGRRR